MEDEVYAGGDVLTMGTADVTLFAMWNTVQGPGVVHVDFVSLSPDSLCLGPEQTRQLTAVIVPENADNKTVSWTSDNEDVATVTGNGSLTGVAAGTATITATAEDGGVTATCEVTVVEISLDSAIIININDIEALAAEIKPSNIDDMNFSWSSDNDQIVTILQNGTEVNNEILTAGVLVKGLNPGTAIITLTVNDGPSAECTVVVLDPDSLDRFFSIWDISADNDEDRILELPLSGDGEYCFRVDWGDGTFDDITGPVAEHAYAQNGIYFIEIDGICNGFGFDDSTAGNYSFSRQWITGIDHWGPVTMHNNGHQFQYCHNLGTTFAPPDLEGITNLSFMFADTRSFNADISGWDTSGIMNMQSMFENAFSFNQDLRSSDPDENPGCWNTSRVTNMKEMFAKTKSFREWQTAFMVHRLGSRAGIRLL